MKIVKQNAQLKDKKQSHLQNEDYCLKKLSNQSF